MTNNTMEQAEPTLLEFGPPAEVRPGSSKRKRSQSRDGRQKQQQQQQQQQQQRQDRDSHTPKRSRQAEWPLTEGEESSDAPDTRQRSVRRKHGKYGLSSISKRHAQEHETGSKFLEGSMNDKPSINPPSMFTRDVSNHSLAISNHSINVDHLMDQYHEGGGDADAEADAAGLRRSIEQHPLQQHFVSPPPAAAARQYASPARRYASPGKPLPESPMAHTPGEHKGGLYRFGRMVASSFNPSNMWGSFSRTFKDTKEEMTMRNIEENRKRAQQKADAEARYAEMKAAGHFAKPTYTVVSNNRPPVQQGDAAAVESEEDADQLGDDPRDSAVGGGGGSRSSRENMVGNSSALPRPSESTGRDSPALPTAPATLRSRKSIFGIRAPSLSSLKRVRSDYSLLALARQSQTSLSPDKQEQIFQQTGIRTLPRSQSKRELGKQYKLSKRVSDLELKLADARRELTCAINNASPLPDFPTRFEKFTPGKHTPTITSKLRSKFIPGKLPSLPSERLLFPDNMAANQRSPDVIMEVYTPAPRNNSIATQPPLDPDATSFPVPLTEAEYMGEKPLPEPPIPEEEPTPCAPPTKTVAQYDDLDARLKALDRSVEGKGRKKKGGSKKRKSDFEDKDYQPGHISDDDEYGVPKRTKKRKSASNSDGRRLSTESPQAKVKQTTTSKKTSTTEELPLPDSAPEVTDLTNNDLERTYTHSTLSSDPLDPIYEEETVTATTKHGSSILVTVTQSNARSSSRNSVRQSHPPRARSASPSKHHRGERKTTSPAEIAEAEEIIEETMKLKPAVETVPDMPNVSLRGRKGRKTPKASTENFQWPDDVF